MNGTAKRLNGSATHLNGTTRLNDAAHHVNGTAASLEVAPAAANGEKLLNGKHLNGHDAPLNGESKPLNGKHVNGVAKRKKPAKTNADSSSAAKKSPAKQKQAKRAAAPESRIPNPESRLDSSASPQPPASSPQLDRRLIDRALAKEPDAWDDLYYRCHQPLLAAIRAIIGSRSADANLIDELAARVWYAVVRDDAKLLNRFDAGRGCSLTTYLALLAKDEASRLFRSEKRRRRRETVVATSDTKAPTKSTPVPGAATITLAEFAATLTPAEKSFYEEITEARGQSSNGHNGTEKTNGTANGHTNTNTNSIARSQANEWQLNHRVRRKLERFLTG
jgi:DNA-directed RNA polymerase specialized sigma24 family protein